LAQRLLELSVGGEAEPVDEPDHGGAAHADGLRQPRRRLQAVGPGSGEEGETDLALGRGEVAEPLPDQLGDGPTFGHPPLLNDVILESSSPRILTDTVRDMTLLETPAAPPVERLAAIAPGLAEAAERYGTPVYVTDGAGLHPPA